MEDQCVLVRANSTFAADSSVENIEEACERFEKMGVQFKKKLTDGKMKHIAFILDCDG
jgi:hypothetical protein